MGVVIPSVIVGAMGSGGSIGRDYIDTDVKQPPLQIRISPALQNTLSSMNFFCKTTFLQKQAPLELYHKITLPSQTTLCNNKKSLCIDHTLHPEYVSYASVST